MRFANLYKPIEMQQQYDPQRPRTIGFLQNPKYETIEYMSLTDKKLSEDSIQFVIIDEEH